MRRAFWPCLVAATVLLAGCSGKPTPKEPDTTSTPSPTATPPPLPEAATHETAEGAEVFLQHFIDVINHASLTGSVDGLENLSADTCTSCSKLIGTISTVYSAGGRYDGGAWSLGPVTQTTSGSIARLTSDVTAAEGTIVQSSGDDPHETPKDVTPITFELEFVEGAWRLRQFAGVAP